MILILERGLVIHPRLPHFGASPDGVITCSCCGTDIAEVKCPCIFLHREGFLRGSW